MLSEAAPAPDLATIAALAPGLTDAELRTLIDLCVHKTGSSREIARRAKIARSTAQRGIDSLERKRMIAVRAGTATKAARYVLLALDTVQIGGLTVRPPQNAGGSAAGPEVASSRGQGGLFLRPPPEENTGDPEAAPVDIEGVDCNRNTIDLTLQKIFQRRPEQFSPAELGQARRWMHGYMRKFGIESDQHPPDEKIAAQFLACGDDAGGWPRLEALLHDLMAERKKAYSYAWFVSVALQRIHGIKPDLVKRQRAALKLVRSRERRDDSGAGIASAELAEIDSIHRGLAQLPGRKRLP